MTISRGCFAALLALCGVARLAWGDDCPYAEVRWLEALKQVQITTGFVERSPDLESLAARLEKQGIVMLESDTLRTYRRTQKVGAHQVVTTIVVSPPVGHGEGGGSSSVDLDVVMDGAALMKCPLWSGSLGLDRIVIDPDRRFVTVEAHDGILRFDGFESRRVIDSDWLAERAQSVEALIVKGPSRFH
jgi:hypothetical protein